MREGNLYMADGSAYLNRRCNNVSYLKHPGPRPDAPTTPMRDGRDEITVNDLIEHINELMEEKNQLSEQISELLEELKSRI